MNNRARIFSDLLSIEAWRSPITSNSREAKVHVELAFHQGRLGGDDYSLPFTFNVHLKRALLNIQVSSPLVINRDSIARGIPEASVELTKYKHVRKNITTNLSGEAKVSPAAFAAEISGGGKSVKDVTFEEEAKIIETVPPILIRPSPASSSSEYCWELEPSYLPFLEGQPWDPISAPRFSIKDAAGDGDEAPVKVFVSCKLEDIDISQLELKDINLDARLAQIVYRDMNKAAATQYIKQALRFASLEPGRMDNRFASVLLADILALSE